jgi:hypothetical protein
MLSGSAKAKSCGSGFGFTTLPFNICCRTFISIGTSFCGSISHFFLFCYIPYSYFLVLPWTLIYFISLFVLENLLDKDLDKYSTGVTICICEAIFFS